MAKKEEKKDLSQSLVLFHYMNYNKKTAYG